MHKSATNVALLCQSASVIIRSFRISRSRRCSSSSRFSSLEPFFRRYLAYLHMSISLALIVSVVVASRFRQYAASSSKSASNKGVDIDLIIIPRCSADWSSATQTNKAPEGEQ